MDLINLKDKVVLITGGYGYLGTAIVESLMGHEANVYVLGRSEEKFNQSFSGEYKPTFTSCDVSDGDSVNKAVKQVMAKEGKIDAIINNAFYVKGNSPTEMADEDFNHTLDGTITSVFRCIKAVVPIMKAQGHGKIVNLASMYGMVAPEFSVYDDSPQFTNPPHYGAAKAGIVQMTKYYASLLGPEGINVNSVAPGPFPSKAVQADEGFINRLADKTCLKRIGKPSDLGGVFVLLCSDASNYITGQNFVVDGGWTSV